jgi:hypothetical protein
MLEGKEVEGKIGDFGSYGLDVADDGSATGDVELHVDKEFFGFLTIKGSGSFAVRADLLAGARNVVKKNASSFISSVGSKFAEMFHKAKDVTPGPVAANTAPPAPAATPDPASNIEGAVPVQAPVV